MKHLENKVVVISGVGSGIGKALAIEFSKSKARLALNDIDQSNLNETVSLCEVKAGDVLSYAFDVSSKEEWKKFRSKIIERYGQVDIVINNAGVALGNYTIDEVSLEDFEWLMGINFWGMVYGTKIFLEDLKARASSAVVNVSSVFGLAGVSRNGPYCASKFGIRGFTETLRMEAQVSYPQVQIHSVHPGGIKTNIARKAPWNPIYSDTEKREQIADTEESFVTSPEQAANTIIKGIKAKRSKILIGKDAWVLDKIVRLFPVGYTKIIAKKVEKKEGLF